MTSSRFSVAAALAAAILSPAAAMAAPPPTPAAAPLPASEAAAAMTPEDLLAQSSYAIGLNLGASLHHDSVNVDSAVFLQGLKDGLAGAAPKYTPEQMRAALTQLQASVQARLREAAARLAEANKSEGAAYLKKNAARTGVVTLPSGLQYEILKTGSGPLPKTDDTVRCQYSGTLINGTEFDSSYKRGEPADFRVDGVIKGWTEALQLMPVGSKWRLVVPSDLAYGEKGAGAAIGPNAVLIFEVELLDIQPKT
jgi:FKBP-type peptidyl-prolyl cis-trans isomerase